MRSSADDEDEAQRGASAPATPKRAAAKPPRAKVGAVEIDVYKTISGGVELDSFRSTGTADLSFRSTDSSGHGQSSFTDTPDPERGGAGQSVLQGAGQC